MKSTKAFSRFARIISAVIFLFILTFSRLAAAPQEKMVYVVAFSTQSEKEAKKAAEKLIGQGYQGEVYLAPINKYVVTAARISEKQARKFKEEAQKKGIMPKYAYLTTGEEFQKRIFPEEIQPDTTAVETPPEEEKAPPAEAKSPEPKSASPPAQSVPPSKPVEYKVTAGGAFVVVNSMNSMDEAIVQADTLFGQGYQGEVYRTTTDKYVVVIGPYSQSKIEQIRNEGVQSGTLGGNAYVSGGKEFREKIYSTEGQKRFTGRELYQPENRTKTSAENGEAGGAKKSGGEQTGAPVSSGGNGNFFVVVKLVKSENEAKTAGQDLQKKGYEVKVFVTDKKEYAVTIGYFPKDQAELVRQNAIQYGDAGEDAALSTGKEFTQIYKF